MPLRPKTLLALCLALLGAWAATLLAEGTLANFGINSNEVKSRLASSFVYGNLPVYPDRKAFHAASPAAQAAFVKTTLGWVKTYTESAAFKTDYNALRDRAKPEAPKSKGNADDQYSAYLAQQRQSIETMKQNIAKMSPDMQKQMEPMLKQMQAQIEESAKNPQMQQLMKQSIAASSVGEQKDYQDEVAKYEKKYPADPKLLVASRLHEFLDLTRDMPFDAKLLPGPGGKMRFADPKWEVKSSDWKLCFRAGKEPVQAARAFAADWLRQIEGK